MAWKGDGSGSKSSPKGGIGGGMGGGMGGSQRGGSGKGGNENAAAGSRPASQRGSMYGGAYTGPGSRPERKSTTGTITPKYGWGDAQISDFGITGALANMVGGILGGDVYAGRTPLGFNASAQRDLGGLGPGAVGNTGHGRDALFPGAAAPLAPAQGLQAAPPAQPQGLMLTPKTWGPSQVNIPGALDYGTLLSSWKYFA